VQKEGKNGAVFVIPIGRPIKAVDQKEFEKKMKNRKSALEARKRQKLKEDKLKEKRVLPFTFIILYQPEVIVLNRISTMW